jgi:pimeloyl-ACP methyl ester carboxylesterase
VAPNDVSRLALIAPAGLWLDEHPLPDIFAMLPYELPPYLFHDAVAGAKIMSAGMDMSDPKFLQAFLVQNARQLGAAGKIMFPIPDRGLASRLYRIKAKTILIWGTSDRLIPPIYAQSFRRGIAGSELVLIPDAGHVAPFEKPQDVIRAIARVA